MPFLSIHNVSKMFGHQNANENISIDIKKGTIFGLLGPNGAGKTTLIRMITRILIPDSGQIFLGGKLLDDKSINTVGYMPEERGLYKNMSVGEQLQYFAILKGLSRKEAAERTDFWLKKFDIESWRNKKIEELSKGMSQKVQFIVTVIHNPDLIILDEPFSGLDPVNSQLIEQEIHQLKNEGKTIIFSTHRMEQVEQICDEIALINHGKKVLNGEVKSLRQRFKKGHFQLQLAQAQQRILEDENIHIVANSETQWTIASSLSNSILLKKLIEQELEILSFNEVLPSIQEIFIQQVKQENA
jgi:ABC-2 type transport system ATP-binding protein